MTAEAHHVGGRVGREDASGEPCGNDPRESAAKGSESWRSSVSACADSNLAGGTGGNSGSALGQPEMGCFSGGSVSLVAPGSYPHHNVELEPKTETENSD